MMAFEVTVLLNFAVLKSEHTGEMDQYHCCWCPGSYIAKSSEAMVLILEDKWVQGGVWI